MHPLVTLIRPVNAVVSGLSAAIGYLVATGTLVPGTVLLALAVFFITGAGNAINDYYDRSIDAVNRPDRPIPSGKVSPQTALRFTVLLFLLGLACAVFTTPLCLAIAVFNSLLLAAYSAWLKRGPVVGNLAVAYLSGSIFLFGGAYAGLAGLVLDLPLAIISFCAMVARELVKDAEDIPGDQTAGADTLAIRIGVKKTAVIAFLAVCLAIAASFIPAGRFGPYYLAGIIPVDIIILAAAARGLKCTTPDCMKKSKSSTLLKAGMFLSLVVFTLSALIL
jgi:geranylgeranylglycerol-phosphate geranylgeranyltransferase